MPSLSNTPSVEGAIHSLLYEGLQSGARMLHDMTGSKFEAGLPRRLLTGISASTPLLVPNRMAVISSLAFGGDITGGAGLVVADTDAAAFARALMHSPVAPGEAMLLSAVEEAANVVAHDALAPMAREMSIALMMAPPKTSRAEFSVGWLALMSSLVPQPGTANAQVFTAPLRGLGGEPVVHFVLCLDSNFQKRIAETQASQRIEVGLGELKLAESPKVLRAASLGSCVAIILYDPLGKKAVMSHVVMPKCPSPEKAAAMPGKFADTAVAALLKKIGTPPARLQAWMVGGANMFYGGASPLLQVGQRNVEGVHESLQKHGLTAVVEDVGKNLGRTVEIFTSTGEVWVRSGPVSNKLPTPVRKL